MFLCTCWLEALQIAKFTIQYKGLTGASITAACGALPSFRWWRHPKAGTRNTRHATGLLRCLARDAGIWRVIGLSLSNARKISYLLT